MDEREPPVPPNELNLQPASGRISAVADPATADLSQSDMHVAPGPRRHTGQSEPCRDELTTESSVVVYYGDDEEVSRGFLIALRAMGVPLVEQPSEPPEPPVARAKP
jgi:hypothetical protein